MPGAQARRFGAVAIGCALALQLTSVTVAADAGHRGEALDRMVRYLQEDQNDDGGFGGEPKEPSSPGFTAWVSIALAAAGINPRNQAKLGGTDAYSYLTAHAGELSYTTDFERELLVVDAAGTAPRQFGGVDLVGAILGRQLAEGAEGGVAFPHEAGSRRAGMNDTIFAVIALSPIEDPEVQAVIQQATTWIEREQNADGSWPATCPRTVAGCSPFGREPEGEADMTAAAIEALNAAGRHGSAAQAKALEYLHKTQNPREGGFAEQLGGHEANADSSLEANVGSTAWVAQALWAAGQNPEEWKPGGVDPLTYMESMQQADGHVRWMSSHELNGVWMTAYAGPGLSSVPLPSPAVAYVPPAPLVVTQAGDGGTGAQAGAGVVAGGGGDGAPLFSRPQSESKGHTPGGARTPAGDGRHRRPHRRNPGPSRTGPAPTRLDATRAASTPAAQTRGARARRASSTSAERHGTGSRQAQARAAGSERGRRVKGIPIDSSEQDAGALEPGAPGLHGAGASHERPWSAIAVGALALLLAVSGSVLERRRPEVLP